MAIAGLVWDIVNNDSSGGGYGISRGGTRDKIKGV
jgi:hypothetical protein